MSSRRLSAHVPLTYSVAGSLPVCFMTADLRFSPTAQDMVSFRAIEGAEDEDDAMSVSASTKEECSNNPVDELSLEWAPPAEPARSHVDWWFLQSDHGRKNIPRRPAPFYPRCTTRYQSHGTCHSRVECTIQDTPSCLLQTVLTEWKKPLLPISALQPRRTG